MKHAAMSTVTIIIIAIVSFLILLPILTGLLKSADAAEIENTCRGSVALRGFQGDTAANTFGLAPGTPLLCETQHIQVPAVPSATDDALARKAAVKRDIGEHIVRAWRMFGNGLVENPFLQSTFADQNCFMAYTFTIDPKQLKNNEKIDVEEMYSYLFQEAHDVTVSNPCYNGGGKCVADVTECQAPMSNAKTLPQPCGAPHEKVCCTASSECENKGGRCHVSPTGHFAGCPTGELSFLDFSCRGRAGFGSAAYCCVSKDRAITFADAVQYSGGPGAIILPHADTKFAFTNEGQYGIMFVGSKQTCGDDCKTTSGLLGGIGGLTFGVVGLAVGSTVGYILTEEDAGSQSIVIADLENLHKMCPGGIAGGAYE